jgi:hypothetical protein
MNENDKKEFFEKFVKTVGETTKHYEFKDVDPLVMLEWLELKKEEWESEERKVCSNALKELMKR